MSYKSGTKAVEPRIEESEYYIVVGLPLSLSVERPMPTPERVLELSVSTRSI
jgi:hypothetical protein